MAIILLAVWFIVSFIAGNILFIVDEDKILFDAVAVKKECEKPIPRNQKCVIYAKPEEIME